jgi:hypothetical protein
MYINDALTVICMMLERAKNGERTTAIHLKSGPGIGKSSIMKQAALRMAAQWKVPVACKMFFLTTVEQPDIRGYGLPSADGKSMGFTTPPWAIKDDDPRYGILGLDEFSQASDDVKKPAAELVLNGQVGDYQLPSGYIRVLASNRLSDRSGVGREMAFLQNRYMEIVVQPNLDAWVMWAEQNNIHPMAIAFAKYRPGQVFADTIPEKPGPFCTPRSLVEAAQYIGKVDNSLFTEMAAGMIGEGTTAEFVAFLKIEQELPTYAEIVKDPKHAKLPDRPDASYAAMQLVAHHVDPNTVQEAFQYLSRLGKEFQTAGLKAVIRRVPQITRTPEFAKWASANKELIFAASAAKAGR